MSLRAQNVRENEANRSNRKWGCKHIQANEVNILMKSGKISLSSISILTFRSMVICPTKVPLDADMISVQPQMSQSLDNHPPPPSCKVLECKMSVKTPLGVCGIWANTEEVEHQVWIYCQTLGTISWKCITKASLHLEFPGHYRVWYRFMSLFMALNYKWGARITVLLLDKRLLITDCVYRRRLSLRIAVMSFWNCLIYIR